MTKARKNKIRSIKFQFKINYTLTGFVLGLLFPILAWSLYLFTDEYSFSLSGISQIHNDIPLNYIIDMTPLLLGLIFYFIAEKIDKERIRLSKERIEKERIIEQYSIFAEQIGKGEIIIDDTEIYE